MWQVPLEPYLSPFYFTGSLSLFRTDSVKVVKELILPNNIRFVYVKSFTYLCYMKKTYKVVQEVDALGEPMDEVINLVNVDDERDYIFANPDDFIVGEIVDEDGFYLRDCSYVDEHTYGTAAFAFRK